MSGTATWTRKRRSGQGCRFFFSPKGSEQNRCWTSRMTRVSTISRMCQSFAPGTCAVSEARLCCCHAGGLPRAAFVKALGDERRHVVAHSDNIVVPSAAIIATTPIIVVVIVVVIAGLVLLARRVVPRRCFLGFFPRRLRLRVIDRGGLLRFDIGVGLGRLVLGAAATAACPARLGGPVIL